MLKKGTIKRVFPGGNTAKGFYSYYDQIIGKDATRLFIIKGGPGVGKSSFMKKIAYEMTNRGYDVEFHQCSSDNNSLDGVVIPALGIAMIDGTAPHTVDPKYPGAVEEILNFGQFWNEEGIVENKDKIIKTSTKISNYFKRAYRFFAAAKSLRDDTEIIYEEALDKAKFNLGATKLKKEVLGKFDLANCEGRIRRLFGSALSPNGVVDYYETIVGPMDKIYYVEGSYIGGMSKFMEEMVEEGVRKGLDVEVYYEPLDEKNIQTVIIPKEKVAITNSQKYKNNHSKKIKFEEFLYKDILEEYKDELEEDKRLMDTLMRLGLGNIAKAKKEHDFLENFYVPNMNFKEIDDLREKILNKILKDETVEKA